MKPTTPSIELSVVIPVYGCADCLRALHQRVTASARELNAPYEIVLVDDCDNRGSWEVVTELALLDTAVKAYRLSRNFGQHAAITAGLAQCAGKWAVVMDCDLQDPPEEIPRLYREAAKGYDVVLARRKIKRQSLFRRSASRLYFRLINVFSAVPNDGEFGSFSIISRKVIDAFLELQDRDRHYLFILHWLGFRASTIEYEHQARHSGASSYDLGRLVQHALGGLFFQTTVLLRWIVYLGLGLSCCGFLLAAYFIYLYFAHSIVPGWTSLVVLLLVIGGFIIMSTGVTGLYIGKIFDQVKGRPLYVIDKEIVDSVQK
jgi:dolichol-phosphate mannosyltransferase